MITLHTKRVSGEISMFANKSFEFEIGITNRYGYVSGQKQFVIVVKIYY